MKKRQLLGYSVWLLVSMAIACARPISTPPSGPTAVEELPTIRLAITDVSGLAELEQSYDEFRVAIADALNTEVEFVPVENYTAATVALKRGEIDLALAGPSEYVVINSRTNAVPVIAVTRPNYRSLLVIPADSEISNVLDLKGQTLAMSDIGSTSGHLGPTFILMEAGLDPKTDLTVEMLGDDGSAAALKAGEVDAWGGSARDYADMLQDDAGSFTVLVEGDALPSDIILASSSVDPSLVNIIRDHLLEHENDLVAALATHETKYIGSTLKPALDEDYDSIRAVYEVLGQGEFIR
ncbi:MAG: PhnD/SsuA/transferrin family substrate-binding protein [Cyanothece sp. SIO2G6]|nr:PhnD/SsuA/transferrin family substrate-binding protein [Cyanothece sp. SIO2G6]